MIRLITGHGEAATLSLLIACEELGEPYEILRLDLDHFEQWETHHRRISPDGKPLALIVDGKALDNPMLAFLYLAEWRSDAGLLPNDPAGHYAVQAGMSQISTLLAPNLNLLGWLALTPEDERADYLNRLKARTDRPKLAGWSAVWRDATPPDQQADEARKKIDKGISLVSTMLGDQNWLIQDQFSVADIAAFALVENVRALTPDALPPMAGTAFGAWHNRLSSRPSVTRAIHQISQVGLKEVYCPPFFL